MTLSPKLYKSLRQNIEAEFEARIRELENQRREAVKALNEAWPKMGGSAEDLSSFDIETKIPSAAIENEGSDTPRGTVDAENGLPSQIVSMTAIRQEVDNVLSDDRVDIVTQSEIKERILQKYPRAKIPSVRSAISHFLGDLTTRGDLELIEKGRAGSPNKYRKTGKSTEANLLGP